MVFMIIKERMPPHTLSDKTDFLVHMRSSFVRCKNLQFNPVQIQNAEAIIQHQQQCFLPVPLSLMLLMIIVNMCN